MGFTVDIDTGGTFTDGLFGDGPQPADLTQLKKEIEHRLRETLIFPSDVSLVSPGSLPKYEYKAKLIEAHYQE